MSNYNHDLLFGVFITPSNRDPQAVVDLARLADEVGLDLATFQDHPYQPRFLDTWTLLSYVAARTERIHLSANVHNIQLRPPAVLARAAASLDLLSGGRFELALGAGAFPDAVASMGGAALTGGRAVDAFEEALAVIRALLDGDRRDRVSFDGAYHRLRWAARGPAPAHDMPIWVGALKPRMLDLVGRLADGWLPSQPMLGPGGLAAGNRIIDEAARAAGRDPGAIRRLLNVTGRFAAQDEGPLVGPPSQWVDELTKLALDDGVSAFILMTDDADTIRRYAAEVAPGVRERVAAEASPTLTPG